MGAVEAPGFTAWDDIAVRSSKAQPIPGVARGDLPALAGRPLRPPTSALGWFDRDFHFCVPGQAGAKTALGSYEATTFWTPLAPADPNVVNGAVLAPEAACPAGPLTEDAGRGLSGLGCPSNRYGVSGLGALPFGLDSLGLDSQSLMWIGILAGAVFLLPKLLKSKKAKTAALRKARAQYRAQRAKIQAAYA